MDSNSREPPAEYREGYALSGKIMLTAIVMLFFVIILMVFLHLYARWYLIRARQRQVRRAHLVFYVDSAQNPNYVTSHATRGLEETVINSLPVFVYSRKTHQDSIECAVCLSEFEENERGRILLNCNHSFHTECIDMWFHSHSTCPLCRSPVEPVAENLVPDASINGISGSASGLCTSCQHEEDRWGSASTSSFRGGRKPVGLIGVTIDVPSRNGNFEDESNTDSPSASHSFRSPMSRMLSFKRMLSWERRGSGSPTVANSVSCGGGSGTTEFGIEQGRDESMPQQTLC
ncbi:hypothetical protein DKX38_013452 [Salix brachista]|uniref:RING-type E3 ubiquitin transferase n=1 Tax=Salix brachista TaxID=2182728 RepID=A0A5N5LRN9_9ROSI|nr:hypothetical protein DKX38_013452 [Salix brachista]